MSVAATVRGSRERSPSIPHPPSPVIDDYEEVESRAVLPDRRGAARLALRRRPAQQTSPVYDAAFAEAYQAYYAKVFAFVHSRVGSAELAKDLTAEIFEKAYTKGHSLRQPRAYAAWLFTIAKNEITSHYRRRQREGRSVDRMKESLWLADRPQDPESRVIESERVGHLMRHLRTLSPRDQELLSLRFDAELTSDEIARVMGIKAMNVRVSMHRALARLRDRMRAEPI